MLEDARALPNLQNWIMPTLDENMRKRHLLDDRHVEHWEAWLSLAVALLLMVSLAMRIAPHDLLALSCLGILMVAQSVTGSTLLPTPEEAVSGFGNQGLITIALLFAVVSGLEFTGGTEFATGWFLNAQALSRVHYHDCCSR